MYRKLSADEIASPSKKNWKVISFPSLLKESLKQPFSIKKTFLAISPSLSNMVFAGTSSRLNRRLNFCHSDCILVKLLVIDFWRSLCFCQVWVCQVVSSVLGQPVHKFIRVRNDEDIFFSRHRKHVVGSLLSSNLRNSD